MSQAKVDLERDKIAEFCRKWKITEFALFGSVLRDDFRPDSDVDVLVTFAPAVDVSLFDHVEMEDELQAIFGRKAHLASRHNIEQSRNDIRKKAILNSAQVVYES
jgi:predicted nucleotidyltransferase